jgi:type II secretory pathway pseudopilin PulG
MIAGRACGSQLKRRLESLGGFSLIELVIVVSLVLIVGSMVASTFRISPIRRVENMAHQLAAHLELARTDALNNRHKGRVVFDSTGSSYTAYVDHDDDDSITEVAAEAIAFQAFGTRRLQDLVIFGRGAAAKIPGDAGDGGITLTSDELNLSEQGFPEPWGTMGTIYLVHERDNTAVAAISVASSGSFKAWRWWPDPGEWR